MKITELNNHSAIAWDAYVTASPNGLPQHLSGWRAVLTHTYGYQTAYRMAWEGEQVVGVLPLYFVHSHLVGNSATTMPGGLCANNNNIAAALLQEATAQASLQQARQLVLQDTRLCYPAMNQTTQGHVYWRLDLSAGAEAIWKNVGSETRRQIRLAREKGLQVEIGTSACHLADFYQVMSRFTHEAGTPIFGFDFVQQVAQTFADQFHVAVVYNKEKRPIGAYFQLLLRNTVFGIWGATLRPFLVDKAVYLAYWELVQHAAMHGYHFLDLGRSPTDSGASQFKAKWRGQYYPIYQQFLSIEPSTQTGSITTQVQTSSKLRYLMQFWSKLPLPLAQFLGPKLRRHVPFA